MANGYRVVQHPAREVLKLRGDSIAYANLKTRGERAFELEYEFKNGSAKKFGLTLIAGDKEETRIGYDRDTREVFFDRTKSGNVNFHPTFSSIERAPAELKNGKLKLHIFVDHSLVEVYVSDGEQVITDQIFPTTDEYKVASFAEGGDAGISLKAWEMNSIWNP